MIINITSIVPALLISALIVVGNNVLADDSASDIQSDESLNLWVDDAPLDLFLSQLALITGRKLIIDGDIDNQQLTGKFNGSMNDTLTDVSEQLQVVFELDDQYIGVVPKSELKTVRLVAPGNGQLGTELWRTMETDTLPGNEISATSNEIVVSGHPLFVERVTEHLTAEIADASRVSEENTVVDAATQILMSEDNAQPEMSVQTETASATPEQTASTTPKPIRWVTDIPGFDTF